MIQELALTAFGGATTTRQPFASWGLDGTFSGAFRSQVPDQLNLTLAGAALLDSPFTFRSKATVYLDGLPFFSGHITDDPTRTGSGSSDSLGVNLAGPWWFFEKLPFLQERKIVVGLNPDQTPIIQSIWLTQFTLNLPLLAQTIPGPPPSITYVTTLLDSQQQLAAIFDFAIARGAWFQYDINDLTAVPVLPTDVLNITCADAIRRQLETIDAVAWFDHSFVPPKLRVQRRVNLPDQTLAMGDAQQVEGVKLKRSYDRAVPYVSINFQQPYSIGGTSGVTQNVRTWPLVLPPDDFNALITTVPLRARSGTVHTLYIKTETVDPTSLAWWKRRKPELDAANNPNAGVDYDQLALVANTWSRQTALPNMLVDCHYSDLMGGNVAKDILTVQASYHRRQNATLAGTRVSAHTLRATVQATDLNFPNGQEITFTEWTSNGEDTTGFDALPQIIFNDLNAPLWDGTVPLLEETFANTVVFGKNLNLTGGRPEWATMSALIQEMSFEAKPGALRWTIAVGSNKKLSAQNLVDQLRAARIRYITAGAFGGNQVSVTHNKFSSADTTSDSHPSATEQNIYDQVAGNPNLFGHIQLAGNAGDPVIYLGSRNGDGTPATGTPSMLLQPFAQTGPDYAGRIGQFQFNLLGWMPVGGVPKPVFAILSDAPDVIEPAWPQITHSHNGVQTWNVNGGPIAPPAVLDPAALKDANGNFHPAAFRVYKVPVMNNGKCYQRSVILFGSNIYQGPDDPNFT